MKKLLLLLGAAVVCLVSPACDMHPKETLQRPTDESAKKDHGGH